MIKDTGNKVNNFGCIRQDYLDFQGTFLGTDFADVTDSILTCCCSKNLGA